jgi:hypothetical protein
MNSQWLDMSFRKVYEMTFKPKIEITKPLICCSSQMDEKEEKMMIESTA